MTSRGESLAFRRALGSFASGVTVMTCLSDGMDHAMTASAVSSVSLEPRLILVAVSRTSRFHDAIGRQEFWGLSILGRSAEPHARWLSTPGRPLHGQLDQVPHHRSSRGYALLDQALARLECRTFATHEAGDHDVVIGEVERARAGPEDDPLLYFRSHYRELHPRRS